MEKQPCVKQDNSCDARLRRGQFNIVFCDGHVEARKARALFDVREDAVLRSWHRDDLPHREIVSQLFSN